MSSSSWGFSPMVRENNIVTSGGDSPSDIIGPVSPSPILKQRLNERNLENIISLRNAILLYKALKNERIREVAICVDGYDTFKLKYPYACKFRTSYLYPKK